MNEKTQVYLARRLRHGVITNLYESHMLTKEDAKELLSGPLTPGDGNTIFDDSSYLEKDFPEFDEETRNHDLVNCPFCDNPVSVTDEGHIECSACAYSFYDTSDKYAWWNYRPREIKLMELAADLFKFIQNAYRILTPEHIKQLEELNKRFDELEKP